MSTTCLPTRSPVPVDRLQPIDWQHPLARDLIHCWADPIIGHSTTGTGGVWRDLASGATADCDLQGTVPTARGRVPYLYGGNSNHEIQVDRDLTRHVGASAMTISMWFYPITFLSARGLFEWGWSTGWSQFYARLDQTTGLVYYGGRGADADTWQGDTTSAAANANQWNHFLMCIDLQADELIGCLNGTVQTASSPWTASTFVQPDLGYTTICGHSRSTYAGDPIYGYCSDVLIWRRRLPDWQMKQFYCESKQSHYPFLRPSRPRFSAAASVVSGAATRWIGEGFL